VQVEALELYKQIIPLLEDKEHHQRFRHLMMVYYRVSAACGLALIHLLSPSL
jgi:hypothetical protein